MGRLEGPSLDHLGGRAGTHQATAKWRGTMFQPTDPCPVPLMELVHDSEFRRPAISRTKGNTQA
jgi:hypothetical protein